MVPHRLYMTAHDVMSKKQTVNTNIPSSSKQTKRNMKKLKQHKHIQNDMYLTEKQA